MSENNKDVLLPLPPEEDDGMLIGSVVNGDLYMLRAAHTVLFSSPPCRRPTVSLENVMPQCPKTAFFTPARSVFEALTNTDINASKIHCFLFPNVFNSLRHYRVRIIKPIPSFLWFGKYQIFLTINPKYQLVVNATTPVILVAPAQIRSASTVTNLATNPVNVLCQPYAAFAKKKGTWVSIVIIPGSSRQLLQRMN